MFPVDSHSTWISFLAALPLVVIVSMLFCAFSWNTILPLNPLSRVFRVTGWIFCWAVAAFYVYLTWVTHNRWIGITPQIFAETTVVYLRHHGSTADEALRLHNYFTKSMASQLKSERVSHYQVLYNDVWSIGFFLILPLIGYGFSRLQGRWAGFIDRILRENPQSRQASILRCWTACWVGAVGLTLFAWFLRGRWLGGRTFSVAWYSWLFGEPGNPFLGLQCQTLAVLVIFVILLLLTPLYLLVLQSVRRKVQLHLAAKPA